MKKPESYDALTARLEEIISQLEEPGIPLERSLKLFDEGAAIVKQCGDLLNAARQRIDTLNRKMEQTANDELEQQHDAGYF